MSRKLARRETRRNDDCINWRQMSDGVSNINVKYRSDINVTFSFGMSHFLVIAKNLTIISSSITTRNKRKTILQVRELRNRKKNVAAILEFLLRS